MSKRALEISSVRDTGDETWITGTQIWSFKELRSIDKVYKNMTDDELIAIIKARGYSVEVVEVEDE